MKKWMYICMAALTITAAVSGCSGNSGAKQETEAAGAPRKRRRKPDRPRKAPVPKQRPQMRLLRNPP